ncbi:hypothetical protein RvY_16393 [Ramazzottius varieornatus]|uniref:Tc1-like transposase DDE domain-containing protein n=1 Tax=Ramazzottius varieornatus TaxID=947166 RepID=A0A1D1VY94_RAMVA|nr:hypothetical protein RvY_16393 [Ramazzottius varieornatus]
MDETWITLDDFNSTKDIYYTGEGMVIPDESKKLLKHWPKKSMVAVGICWNGMSRAYCVDGSAKVTAAYFIENFLKRMVKEDLPRLYGNQAKNVSIHFDNAKSHVAILTKRWLNEYHPKYIYEAHWMADSPDLPPFDCGINGFLEKILNHRKATTVNGLSRIVEEVCDTFDLAVICRTLDAWKPRVETMLERMGDHVEIK